MIHRLCRAAAALALLAVAACASVADGVSQNITVTTDPDGAKCDLVREGKSIGIVNPTPGTINVDKDADDITITCERDAYLATDTTITSKFTGATFGNIILGGGIGILIDAASGANNRYPERVDVIMTPAVFRSAAERDSHFAKLQARLRKQAADAKAAIAKECEGELSGSAHCESGPKEIDKNLASELQRLEQERQQVVIDPSGSAAAEPVQPAPRQVARATQPAPVAAPATSLTIPARASGNPTCAEQAQRLGVNLASHNCLKIKASGNFEVARECESSYDQITTTRRFRSGEEILIGSGVFTGGRPGVGGSDVLCVRGTPGTWAFASSDSKRFVIVDRFDDAAVWCRGGQGC